MLLVAKDFVVVAAAKTETEAVTVEPSRGWSSSS